MCKLFRNWPFADESKLAETLNDLYPMHGWVACFAPDWSVNTSLSLTSGMAFF